MTRPAQPAEDRFDSVRRSAEHGSDSVRRSAEHGFDSGRRSAEHGFTLVELLVALAIFTLLSVGGLMLMRASISAQGAVAERLDADSRLLRVHALLRQDLEQAVPRITRMPSGLLAPAFFGRQPPDAEPVVLLVRAGLPTMEGSAHPSLQKVEYLFRDGRLERRIYPMLDGTEPQEPVLLLDNIADLTIGYRARSGEWLDSWQRPGAQDLPVALRIVLTLKGKPPLTWLFLVAPGEARSVPDELGQTGAPDAP